MKVGLLASEAIEIFADEHVEALFARHAEHAGKSRSIDSAGAGHSLIAEGGDDEEALALGPGFAIGNLIVAGAFVLEVGAKAGVDRGAGRRCHPVRSPPDGLQWLAARPRLPRKPARPRASHYAAARGALLSI
ncbi:hypothetical protein ASG47_19585 [Devosia sp. Leaf420]|nr:hypothetical protein ASG47_19585 [Devosia sp. Leaf420]